MGTFPDLPTIDSEVYKNIQQTCTERWDLENMKMDTFSVRLDRDEYLVGCDGVVEGELYRCWIRTDSEGKMLKAGRALRTSYHGE